MILEIHSDTVYYRKLGTRSRARGHFFLSNNEDIPSNNGAILSISQIIKAAVSSAAEAEVGSLFVNAKESAHIRNILNEMGQPQPPTPMQTDNTTANGFINNKIHPKQMKSMDIQFHWLRDRMTQIQFRFH